MPATEQTWRDQKLLHIVFGATSLALLISTVWMFAKDHAREWKGYQRSFRSAEQRLTVWRKQAAESADYKAEIAGLESQLLEQSAKAMPPDLYQAFKSEVENDAGRRDAAVTDFTEADQLSERLAELAATAQRAQAAAATAKEQADAAWTQVKALGEAAEADDEAVDTAMEAARAADVEANEAMAAAEVATEDAAAVRENLLAMMDREVKLARAREDELLSRRKFKSADLDKSRADLDIMVRDSKFSLMDAKQSEIDGIREELEALTLERQAATGHRLNLEAIMDGIRDAEININKRIEDSQSQIARLEATLDERDLSYINNFLPGKKLLTLPIADAFNSPLTIDNLWTENLTITNGSFGQVRRFDRCTTCHRGIAKAAPGTADQPAYVPERTVELAMMSPTSEPQPTMSRGTESSPTLLSVYGINLASSGLLDPQDVTIDYVAANSLAAKAEIVADELDARGQPGLQVGDVILAINGDKVLDSGDAEQLLFNGFEWGEPLALTVRRGLPQPFTSHPRLDLFVGSLSPHQQSVFGCTSCHEGQGSATDFKWASHYPSNPKQMKEWTREHGWFNNHHWIYPMFPNRLAESGCLKCHHNVTELEPSERFPEPPAPKVVGGYHVIEDYGCFGCHEINGYDGPDKRIGPDLRLEPNYYAAAAQLKADPAFASLSDSAVGDADELIQHPDDDELRHELRDLVLADQESDSPVLTDYSHKMADVLQDAETPGTYRKVGPSLRYVAEKLGEAFLYDWIREPKHFRPSTKMPQFFGLWDHLQTDPEDLELAERYERIEILGVVRYLLDRSQNFEYLPLEPGTAAASADRGKVAFEIRGCLACHQHQDFPAATSVHGPNLTGLGDKFAAGSKDARGWLYSWLKKPTHYSARTMMPNLYLDPYEDKDGQLVDPAADIAEYLLSDSVGWHPDDDVASSLQPVSADLDGLTLEYLEAAFPKSEAREYLASGVPAQLEQTLKGAEVELVGSASADNKLMYIGRKTIAKYGCYACHDIPGFEDAKPIGAALADWGRKESSKLAFEHIAEYLHEGHHGGGHGTPSAGDHGGNDHGGNDHGGNDHGWNGHGVDNGHGPGTDDHAGDTDDTAEPFDDSFYMYQISQHDRSGFIWQKLKEPRSYDYKKTHNKGYNERLRMPMFPITPQQREEVVTFVLGLVAEPPAQEFVFEGDERTEAINEGWAVIQKYNCAGCHMFEPEQWDLEFAEGDFESPNAPEDYPFVAAHFSSEALANSGTPDRRRGVLKASLRGVPGLRNEDALQDVLDGEGDPIDPEDLEYFDPNHPEFDPDEYLLPLQYPFELWEPAAIGGDAYDVGLVKVTVPEDKIVSRREAVGGDLAKILLPRVLELEKQDNPAANGTETWGWVPPHLIGQGNKVQPDWLYDFLINPYPIRPAVFLRMPQFNFSPDEVRKIVNYFAAKDNANYPFEYNSRTQVAHLESLEEQFQEVATTDESRFDHAMKIVTNSNYCIKCHLVGEYAPEGSIRALAPDLSVVQHRLRPEYMRKWIAKPTSILPYTSMPVNIPFDEGVSQELYPGTSTEQVDALVDLLMNYGHYTSTKTDVRELVKAAAGASPPPDESAALTGPTPSSGAE